MAEEHSIRIGIDSSEAERGAKRVTGSLRDIQQEAARVSGKPISIELDGSSVASGGRRITASLRDIVSRANAIVGDGIEIGLDSSRIQGGLQDVARSLRDIATQGRDIPIGLDTSRIDGDVREINAAIRNVQDSVLRQGGAVEVPIDVDTASITEAADRVSRLLRDLAGRSGDAKIPLGFDLEGLDDETDEIVRRIKAEIDRNLEAGISVEASLDVVTEAAMAEINRFLLQASQPVDIPVSADTTQAQDEIDRLSGRLGRAGSGAKVKIDGDASGAVNAARQATDAVDEVVDAADRVSRLGDFKIGFGNFISSAKKAIQSLTDFHDEGKKLPQVASEAQNAWGQFFEEMETAELAIEGFAAVTAAIVGANFQFEDMASSLQAVTGSALKAENALKVVEEFALNTPFAIQDVTDAFVALKREGLDANSEALSAYGNVASALNLTLKELAEAVGQAATGNFDKLNETQLKAEQQGNRVIFTYRGMRTEVENTSRAIAQFVQEMGNTTFADGMQQAAEGTKASFDRMTDAAAKFAREMGEGGLNKGLEDFFNELTRSMEGGKSFAALFGSGLQGLLDRFAVEVRNTTREINMLTDAWNSVTGAFRDNPLTVPVQSDPVDDAIKEAGLDSLDLNDLGTLPPEKQQPFQRQGIFLAADDKGKVSTKPNGLSLTAPDNRDEQRIARARSKAQSLAESQARANRIQTASLSEQIPLLNAIIGSYDRGRTSVEQYRNAQEDLSTRLSLNESVGKKNAAVLAEMASEAKGLQEIIAFKGVVLDMSESIQQTDALAAAYERGTGAVREQEAANAAWNQAVQLGMAGRADVVQQLFDLEIAAQKASTQLGLAQELFAMDVDIGVMSKMVDAYKQGGSAVRDAAIENEAYAIAVQRGVEADAVAVARIQEKVRAYRDMSDAQEASQEFMNRSFDIEGMEGELRLSTMIGEAREIESVKLQMLIDKKRQLQDATATLTAEEERQAETIGRLNYQTSIQSNELQRLATSIPNASVAFDQAVSGGLMHFEDALVDIVTRAKSAREAFADMAKSIAQDLARMAIRMAIIQPLAMMFGGGFGGGVAMMGAGMGAGMAGVAHTGGVIGTDRLPTRRIPAFHSGGIVGHETPSMRSLPPVASWTKYHTGGLAGNEVPTILQKGEGVFTQGQMANLAPAGSGGSTNNITVNVAQNQNGDPGAAERQGRIIAQQIKQAVDERLIQNTRPGGILNQKGY